MMMQERSFAVLSLYFFSAVQNYQLSKDAENRFILFI